MWPSIAALQAAWPLGVRARRVAAGRPTQAVGLGCHRSALQAEPYKSTYLPTPPTYPRIPGNRITIFHSWSVTGITLKR